VIDEGMGDEIRVTVIATGFDHGGVRRAQEERQRPPRDRGPRIDERQRDSLAISDDDLDIPPFLR
jgi:cell division protein FtsZ